MAGMTEMEKLRAGLPYRYDDSELVEMKDTASMRCAKLNAVDPLDAAGREAAARDGLFEVYQYESGAYSLHVQFSICNQELSAQDIKVKRPFEVGGEVVRAYSVTDEEITAVQNEINAQKQ